MGQICKTMEGVIIKPLGLISENEKASTFRIDLNSQNEGILGFRKAGTVFGGHFHEGKSASKAPEKLTLIEGVLVMTCKNMQNQQEVVFHVKAPVSIEIYPFIWHKLHALTNVVFIEMNSLEEHIADTKYE